jgi:hypothetical protein
VLLEEVRAPGAARAEVDALLAGLSQPLPSDASPRERADLLLSLIEDAQIADYTSTNGRTVRVAAIQALLALGYPYALEVPPEALEAKARDEGTRPGLLSTRKGQVGFGLVALAGLLQLAAVLSLSAREGWISETIAAVLIAIITGTTFLPAFLTVLGHNLGKGGLKMAGTVWLVFVSLFWLLPGLVGFGGFPFNLIAFVMGGLILVGSLRMSLND